MTNDVYEGRNVKILESTINGTEYTDPPQSRIEELLLELKEVIEQGGGGGSEIDYSTTEQDSGRKWIDGKTIYQKTIDVGNLPNNTTKNVEHNIENIDRLIRFEGNWVYGNQQGNIPNPATNSYTIMCYTTATELVIKTSTNLSEYTGFVTLFYTKVEDNE